MSVAWERGYQVAGEMSAPKKIVTSCCGRSPRSGSIVRSADEDSVGATIPGYSQTVAPMPSQRVSAVTSSHASPMSALATITSAVPSCQRDRIAGSGAAMQRRANRGNISAQIVRAIARRSSAESTSCRL
jgi:hypothetical protein